MIHRATPDFWACYRAFPSKLQETADRAFAVLRANPRQPSLHFKKVGRYWSVRVDRNHRALAVEHQGSLLWFWIGSHAEYDRITG